MALKDAMPEEQRIVGRLIADAIKAGYYLAVFDGEEQTTQPTQDVAVIKEALCTTDFDKLRIYWTTLAQVGAVLLIWGNGRDVLSDWSDKPAINEVLRGALEVSDEIDGEEIMREVEEAERTTRIEAGYHD